MRGCDMATRCLSTLNKLSRYKGTTVTCFYFDGGIAAHPAKTRRQYRLLNAKTANVNLSTRASASRSLNHTMHSVEFLNRCNLTHPDEVPHALLRVNGAKFLQTKARGDSAYKISISKGLHISRSRDYMWVEPKSIKGAARAVASVSAEENSSRDDSNGLFFGKPTDKEELAALRESAMRANLMKKLSDANLYGRHLQRQLRDKEDSLLKCKNELATMETEMQGLVSLAQEVVRIGVSPGTRKIDGKYIQSHLAVKLKEMCECLHRQVTDIEAVCFRDIPFVWYGMAEDVQVMGSFDGWTRGLQLSPESTGSFTKFSATLKLRPGRYQIKLLIDGRWQTLPDLPLVGEGPTANNLLVVE